jgi:hypothetical protein
MFDGTRFPDADRPPSWIKSGAGFRRKTRWRPVRGFSADRPDVQLQPLVDIEQPLFAAEPVPLTDQAEHDDPHGHQVNSGFRAVLVAVDLFADLSSAPSISARKNLIFLRISLSLLSMGHLAAVEPYKNK